jgi:aspartate/methionine/tyrosine aminotransferase
MPTSEGAPAAPPLSDRVGLLGNGVFARNDKRKEVYLRRRRDTAQVQGASGLPQLLDLSLGSTDLQPPQEAVAAIRDALNEPASAAYCLHAATRPFREAAAAWAWRRFDVRVNPDTEVMLLVGSQEGTAHLPLAVLNPGDAALLLDPYYPSHLGGIQLASGVAHHLPLRAEEGWRPHFERLTSSQWDQLKLMVLGFPHNPTATVGAQAWLDAAVERALRHGLVLAHDNPYVDLALEGEAPALLRHPHWRRCGIEFFSLSKSWCLGGYRLAYAIGAEPLITALRQVKGVVDFNQSLALQAGAIAALEQAPHWPQRLRAIYRERRDRMAAALEAEGWPAARPAMALYLWLALPPAARALNLGSEAFSAALLEATGVALTPGNGFGPAGEGWLRLALVHPAEDLEAGATRLGAWLRTLDA